MKIPIQNIYYLLCYAWDKLDERDVVSVEQIQSTEIVDLFARVLSNGVSYLRRRGLDRGYILYDEETARIRGKIDFAASLKRNLLHQAKVQCVYDELSYNVLHNQIVKSVIYVLLNCGDVDDKIHKELLLAYRSMDEVETLKVEKRHFGLVQLNRNNHFYDFLLKICELICENLLISEKHGQSKFRDFLRDEKQMAALFEAFVRNFYKKEQKRYDVKRKQIAWAAKPLDDTSAEVLPGMHTDIYLASVDRRIVIDTKYYKEALTEHFGKKIIRPGNLYQLHAYLTNLALHREEDRFCEGVLLYPTIEEALDYRFDMQGHKVAVRSINLNQNWTNIRQDLLTLVN